MRRSAAAGELQANEITLLTRLAAHPQKRLVIPGDFAVGRKSGVPEKVLKGDEVRNGELVFWPPEKGYWSIRT